MPLRSLIRLRWSRGGGAPQAVVSVLIRRLDWSSLSAPCENTTRGWLSINQKRVLAKHQICSALNLDSLDSWTVRNKNRLFEPPSLWYLVIVGWTKIGGQQGLQSSQSLTGAEESNFKRTHSHGHWQESLNSSPHGSCHDSKTRAQNNQKKKKSKMIPEHCLVPESLKNTHLNDSMSRGSKNKSIKAPGGQN